LLAWGGWGHGFEIHVRDVRVDDATGREIARVPEMVIRLSRRALLRGLVAPAEIEVLRPTVALHREHSGAIGVDVGDPDRIAAGGETSHPVVDALRAWTGPHSPAPALRTIVLRDATVTIAAPGGVWRARDVDLELGREADAVRVRARGMATTGTTEVPVTVEGAWRLDGGVTQADLAFGEVDPTRIAAPLGSGVDGTAPRLTALLGRVALPLTGTVHVAFDERFRPTRMTVALAGRQGAVGIGATAVPDLAVAGLALTAAYDGASDTIDVQDISLDLGASALLRARGAVRDVRGEPAFEAEATVARLPTDLVLRHWPAGVASGARRWLGANLSSGRVDHATARVDGRIAAGALSIGAVTGTFTFERVGLRYLDGPAPITNAAGSGSYEQGRWTFHVARGASEGLEIERAIVRVAPLPAGPRIAVDASVRGPLADGLSLLARLPADAVPPLGAIVTGATGSMSARVRFETTPAARFTAAGTGLAVSGRLRDVTIPRVYRDLRLERGDFAVEVRDGSLELSGGAALGGGAPLSLRWQEGLASGRPSRRVDLEARVGTAERAALGLDLRPWVDGPIDVEAHLTMPATRAVEGTLELTLGLAQATVAVPALGFAKPVAAPARAAASLRLTAGAIRAIDRADIDLGRLSARGRATIAKDGAPDTLDADATLARPDGKRPAHVTVTGRPGGGKRRLLTLASSDAGAVLAAVGFPSEVRGGRLRLSGTTEWATARSAIDGHIEVRDVTVTRSPVLGQIAALASLSGIAGALGGRGIAFDSVTADLEYRDPTIRVRHGRAKGSTLRLLTDGTLDQETRTVAFHGTLVPSYYGLNALPARVPLVGGLMTGRKEEGVLVVEFDVSGPFDAPRATVRPLRSVAPGLLRDLFRDPR
jgi:hypothetical protein